MQTPATTTVQPPAAPRTRRVGLDAARGVMLVVYILVIGWFTAPASITHARWVGVHLYDIVFPTFVTLTGCGLALANGRGVNMSAAARRAIILIAVGLVSTVYVDWLGPQPVQWSTLRLFGVLQLFAVVTLVISAGHLVTRTAVGWWGITAVLAVAHTALLARYALHCPGAELTRACNPSRVVDTWLVGASHLLDGGRQGHDPEGLISIFGAVVTASAGAATSHALAGRVLPERLGRNRRAASPNRVLVALTGCVLFAGLALASHHWVPAMKRLWTVPFGLGVAAVACAVLIVLDVLLDGPPSRPRRRPRAVDIALWPLVALGLNSLFVYFGWEALLYALLTLKADDKLRLADHLASWAGGVTGLSPAVGFNVLAVLFWVVVASVLHWRRIYLRP